MAIKLRYKPYTKGENKDGYPLNFKRPWFNQRSSKARSFPVDTGRSLNVHKTSYVRSIYVLYIRSLFFSFVTSYFMFLGWQLLFKRRLLFIANFKENIILINKKNSEKFKNTCLFWFVCFFYHWIGCENFQKTASSIFPKVILYNTTFSRLKLRTFLDVFRLIKCILIINSDFTHQKIDL